jgi:hypothetical protein
LPYGSVIFRFRVVRESVGVEIGEIVENTLDDLTLGGGVNLLQSAFTRWYLMEDILSKLGLVKKS